MRNGSATAVAGTSTATNRRAAMTAGVLLITATVTNVVGTSLSRSLLGGSDPLSAVASHANQVAAGALLELIAAGASAGIAIALYPVLKRWGASMALGSVVFRAAEAVMYMISAVNLLSLLAVSQRFTSAVAADEASLRTLGDAFVDIRHQAALVGVFAFCVGSSLYYFLFYVSRLIPRWLSGWGMGAVSLMFLACLLALFRQEEVRTFVILVVPLGVQEMVLAVWLIAKGFAHPDTPSIPMGERESVPVAIHGGRT